MSQLKELNDVNGASKLTHEYAAKCLTEFSGDLCGVEMGIAYGGGIRAIGKLWGNRGTVYGFDTFEGHPKQIAEICEFSKKDKTLHAANCMDPWYDNKNEYGTDRIKYDFIRSELDKENLTNVKLVKGLVTEKTDVSFLPNKIHYALIDLDFPISQWDGYNLLKNRIIKGGYLCLHDMIPAGHIYGNYEYYQKMLSEKLFDVVIEDNSSLLVVLRKK